MRRVYREYGWVLRVVAMMALAGGLALALYAGVLAVMDLTEPGRHAYHACLLDHRGVFDHWAQRACRAIH